MTRQEITQTGNFLQRAIDNISIYNKQKKSASKEETLHVPNVANALLFAYEQLRNASENIEDHLLLQQAIQRFYKRSLTWSSPSASQNIAKELIIELTQAEYIENDTIRLSEIKAIGNLVGEYIDLYKEMVKTIDENTARKWILELLSVKSEQVINNPVAILSFAHFAHAHFAEIIEYSKLADSKESVAQNDYPTILYIAVHKGLLKSDNANVRVNLMELYYPSGTSASELISFNKKYDELASLSTTASITKFINRNGAPLRVMRSAFFDEKSDHTSQLDLTKKTQIDNLIEVTIEEEYKSVRKSVNLGVIKSVIFLLITKALIGLIIEIPYDLITTGTIIMVPLLINLLFPSLFIAISAVTFRMPGEENKKAIKTYIQSIIYSSQRSSLPAPRYVEKTGNSFFFNAIYLLTFLIAFYFIATRLEAFDFNIVQGLIFFIFFSTASFLGYRLTAQIKELELITTNQGFIAIIRDFFYSPFIFVGKKISYRFGQLNIIAQMLDIIIDLPLKTSVRLVRQWNVFLNNKKDELL